MHFTRERLRPELELNVASCFPQTVNQFGNIAPHCCRVVIKLKKKKKHPVICKFIYAIYFEFITRELFWATDFRLEFICRNDRYCTLCALKKKSHVCPMWWWLLLGDILLSLSQHRYTGPALASPICGTTFQRKGVSSRLRVLSHNRHLKQQTFSLTTATWRAIRNWG